MSVNGLNRGDQDSIDKTSSNGDAQWQPDLIIHLALALSQHLRELRRSGMPVPREIDELAASLLQSAKSRQDTTFVDSYLRRTHYARVPDRMLLTKAEAAERLGVSIRTVERLAATGRLPLVHVERAARIRVSDLEAYVHNLATDGAPACDFGR